MESIPKIIQLFRNSHPNFIDHYKNHSLHPDYEFFRSKSQKNAYILRKMKKSRNTYQQHLHKIELLAFLILSYHSSIENLFSIVSTALGDKQSQRCLSRHCNIDSLKSSISRQHIIPLIFWLTTISAPLHPPQPERIHTTLIQARHSYRKQSQLEKRIFYFSGVTLLH